MKKIALLIGVSEYTKGFSPLPNTITDIEAMQRVLADPLMGNFQEVKQLINPDRQQMELEIEALFSARERGDLTLLYFTGHGIKDDHGDLYFATCQTRKNPLGYLVKSTAVAANFVHKIMGGSRSKRQVVILDCCFSGAFADGMTAKSDGSLDIHSQLGGEGRVILTSSTSTQYSFEQKETGLSIYTRYIVQGIENGAADLDRDGMIAVDELHDYAKMNVQETAPAMKPEIYSVKEGFRIFLAYARPSDPQLHYRREVERFVERGEVSDIARTALEALRCNLHLSTETASRIEEEVLEPSRVQQKNLRQYEQTFFEAVWREYPLSPTAINDLQYLQRILGLREDDVRSIEAQVLSRKSAISMGTIAIPHHLSPSPSLRVHTPVPADTPPTSLTAKSASSSEPWSSFADSATTEGTVQNRSRSWFSIWLVALVVTALGGLATGGGYAYWSWHHQQQMDSLSQASEQTLAEATQHFEAGEFEAAIAHLNTIPSNSPLYLDAQATADMWRANWDADQQRFHELQVRLRAGNDLAQVEQLVDQMLTPYWQEQADETLDAAQDRIASHWAQALQAAEKEARRAQEEAEAARQEAEALRAAAEREQAIIHMLNHPPSPDSYYRVVEADQLFVRDRPVDGVIGDSIDQLLHGTTVLVTGNQERATLMLEEGEAAEDVVWVEISAPISGWVSRHRLEGPITE